MARNSNARARRATAARVREFREGRGYRSVIPRGWKTRARNAYVNHLRELASRDPKTLTEQEKKQLARAASYASYGRAAYADFNLPELKNFWYHNKR